MRYTQEIDDVGRDSIRGSVYFVIVALIVIVGIGGFLLVARPWVIEQEREQAQRSQQYVETQQEELLHLANEWHTAPDASKPAIETRMRAMANRIPDEDVPPEAQEIIQ